MALRVLGPVNVGVKQDKGLRTPSDDTGGAPPVELLLVVMQLGDTTERLWRSGGGSGEVNDGSGEWPWSPKKAKKGES